MSLYTSRLLCKQDMGPCKCCSRLGSVLPYYCTLWNSSHTSSHDDNCCSPCRKVHSHIFYIIFLNNFHSFFIIVQFDVFFTLLILLIWLILCMILFFLEEGIWGCYTWNLWGWMFYMSDNSKILIGPYIGDSLILDRHFHQYHQNTQDFNTYYSW